MCEVLDIYVGSSVTARCTVYKQPTVYLVADAEVRHICGLRNTNGGVCQTCYDWLHPAFTSQLLLRDCADHARD
jgi:hypothetical protein